MRLCGGPQKDLRHGHTDKRRDDQHSLPRARERAPRDEQEAGKKRGNGDDRDDADNNVSMFDPARGQFDEWSHRCSGNCSVESHTGRDEPTFPLQSANHLPTGVGGR